MCHARDGRVCRVDIRKVLAHAKESETGEARRAHRDEHAGTAVGVRQPMDHQASHVRTIHEDGDEHAQALEGDAGDEDREGVFGGLRAPDDRGEGAAEHDGEDGEDPAGRHGLEGLLLGVEEVAVLEDGDAEGDGDVYPEEDAEGRGEPWAAVRTAVFVDVGQDVQDGEPECGKEE